MFGLHIDCLASFSLARLLPSCLPEDNFNKYPSRPDPRKEESGTHPQIMSAHSANYHSVGV